MARFLLSIILVIPLLFSVGHAAPTFHDIWNRLLPRSASSEGPVPDHLLHGEVTTTEGGAGEVFDHSKSRVDFGTKAWPYVYYVKREREGTLDWGTKSWPYIFYVERRDKDDLGTESNGDHYGRKAGGHGFRL